MQILLANKYSYILPIGIFLLSFLFSNTLYAQKEKKNYKWVEDTADTYDAYNYEEYETVTTTPTYTPPAQNGKLFLGGFLLGSFVFLLR